MRQFLFYLPDEDIDKLREKSLDTGAPMAHYLRQGVKDQISERIPIGVMISGNIVSGVLLVGVTH